MALFAGCLSRTFYLRFSTMMRCDGQMQYLRLQIAVNDAVVPHQRQRHQHLTREAAYEGCCETNKAIRFDEFVEVDAQQFHSDAEVAPKVEVLRHLDDVMFLIGVLWNLVSKERCEVKEVANPFAEVVKNLYLDQSLVVETFLVPDDLDSDRLASTMVTTTQDLAEGTLPKCVHHLVSECQMIMGNNLIIAAFVVIAVIVYIILRCSLLLFTSRSDEVYHLIVEDFPLLVGGKVLGLAAL
jgi:hypothetical protein